MQRVSSNLTLFFKLFVPTFWIVFFGAVTLALWLNKEDFYGDLNGRSLRIGALVFYFTGLALFYFTLLPLKRVEMDGLFVYVTNYFRNFRYPWHNVESIADSQFLSFSVVTINLKTPGNFGKKIRFIASNRLYRDFLQAHPEVDTLREKAKP